MAYTRKQKTIRMEFDGDHEWAGLVVRTRALSTGVFTEITQFAGMLGDGKAKIASKDMGKISRLFGIFAEALLEWNLQEEDENGKIRDVPATVAGVQSQDIDFIIALIVAWVEQISGLGAGLGKGSSSGGISPAPPLPMEPLSPNPQS